MNASPQQRDDMVDLVAIDPKDVGVSDAIAFDLLLNGSRSNIPGALITIVEVIGGAPRPLGTHMAVLSDGRYCGYVSGGCVEPAIAREAIEMVARGTGGIIRIGAGSPWIDLRLPCGGGLALQVVVEPDVAVMSAVAAGLAARLDFSTSFAQALAVDDLPVATGLRSGVFHRRYVPDVRLVVAGEGREASALATIAEASGLAVQQLSMRDDIATFTDRRTAIILLDHDHAREQPMLLRALASQAFYIGAMGSVRTHAARCDDLRRTGMDEAALGRIHGPIGVVDRTRDSRSLAFSILAEISREAALDEAAQS